MPALTVSERVIEFFPWVVAAGTGALIALWFWLRPEQQGEGRCPWRESEPPDKGEHPPVLPPITGLMQRNPQTVVVRLTQAQKKTLDKVAQIVLAIGGTVVITIIWFAFFGIFAALGSVAAYYHIFFLAALFIPPGTFICSVVTGLKNKRIFLFVCIATAVLLFVMVPNPEAEGLMYLILPLTGFIYLID